MFTVLHKDFYKQKAKEVIACNQERSPVTVSELRHLCTPEGSVMTRVCDGLVCTYANQGFQTTFST